MKLRILLAVLIAIFGLAAGLEAGDIYQWVDKDGVQHFTDGPPPPGAERVEGLSDKPPDAPRATAGPAKRENPGAVQAGENVPPEREDAGPVEEEEGNRSSSRDDYWRRMGWGNNASQAQSPGPGEEGEPPPPEQEGMGGNEGGENAPAERKID